MKTLEIVTILLFLAFIGYLLIESTLTVHKHMYLESHVRCTVQYVNSDKVYYEEYDVPIYTQIKIPKGDLVQWFQCG